jgi:hypothetical protein
MRVLGSLLLALTSLTFALLFACEPLATPNDGSLVGNFAINATLQSNACAPAYNPVSPTTFTASLRVSGTTATWSAAGSSVTGTASGNTIHVVAHSAMSPFTNCVIDQTETIDATYTTTPTDSGTPDAGAHSATINGTDTITRSTSSGVVCDAVLLINGGSYPMLPCTASFTFTGATN